MIKKDIIYTNYYRSIIIIIRRSLLICLSLCFLCSGVLEAEVKRLEIRATKCRYEGHDYIMFNRWIILHDHDCKCKDKE